MTTTLIILFWTALAVVFYTYIGYAIVLYAFVKIKEWLMPRHRHKLPPDEFLPDVTLFITAYNEEAVVDEKMKNSLALDYPAEKLHILWVTDGSNDGTNERLRQQWPQAKVSFLPERRGKTAAMNRGITIVDTPIVVFTDANTMVSQEAIREMVKAFIDPAVGCVAGEKRISTAEKAGAATGGEGIYWRYESCLKALDSRLYSAVGAAGELFAVRRELFEPMETDTLLDDFVLSMRIAMQGYSIAYRGKAYAVENGSADMREEAKRKVRIAAGGLQSIGRLARLLQFWRYGLLSFQYISHRVLRWSVAPVSLVLLLPLNIAIVVLQGRETIYCPLLAAQLLFYAMAICGHLLANKEIRLKAFFIPYYFLFMNINVFRGMKYLWKRRNDGGGAWEKSARKQP